MEKKKNADKASGRTPRFLLLMRDDLRAAIEKAAVENGRTLTAEINIRLRNSLERQGPPTPAPIPAPAALVAQTEPGEYKAAVEATAIERAMLQVFRALPPEKQLALLSLFK